VLTLGLDPSLSSYGWCVYDGSKTGLDKVVERGRWKTPASQIEVARYITLRDSLRECVRKYDIKRAAAETPPIGPTGDWSQEKLYALFIVNMEVMYTEGVDIVLFAPTQLHLYAKQWGSQVVKGEWFKSDMQSTAQLDVLDLLHHPRNGDYWDNSPSKRKRLREAGWKKHPRPIVDVMDYPKDVRKSLRFQSDEADAYLAASCGHRFWEHLLGRIPEADLTPSEWDIFAKTHTYTRGKKAGLTDRDGIIFKEGSRFYRFATAA